MRSFIVSFLLAALLQTIQAQTPSQAATNVVFKSNSTFCSQTTLSWTKGNGSFRIVVASKGAAITNLPVDNAIYIANSDYGSGSSLSATEFVVYKGSGTSVVVNELEANTTYYFSVFEFNGAGSTFSYRTADKPEASVTTKYLNADFTLDDSYQCEKGNLTNFTSTVTQNGGATLYYNWNFDDGNTSTVHNPSHTYSTYKLYNVKLAVTSFKCKAEVVKNDTIAPWPSVSFKLDPTVPGNTLKQCFTRPNYFAFENTFFIGTLGLPKDGGFTNWYYGDGTFDKSVIDGNVSYAKPGKYFVKLVIGSSQNEIEYCVDSATVQVEVLPNPIDSALIKHDTVLCQNGNIFHFEHKIADLTANQDWTFGDGGTANGQEVTHTYSSNGTFPFKLEVTDANGCFGEYEDSVKVVPRPNNSIVGLRSQYCEGEGSIQLASTIAGGTWLGTHVDALGMFSPTKLGKNILRYAVDEGCKDTVEASCVVIENPVLEVGLDTSICQGASFVRSIVKDSASILWSTGDVDSFISINSPGLYWVEKTNIICSKRDSLRVIILPAPQIELGRDSLLCGDGERVIDVTSPEATYVWNDGYVGGNRVITATGDYEVTVTNKCGTTSDRVSLEFLPYVCDILVPNAFSPNNDGFNDLFRPQGNVTVISMLVYNRWGELLYENNIENFGWDGIYKDEPVQAGQYYFMIRYLLPKNGKLSPVTVSGEVYLVR